MANSYIGNVAERARRNEKAGGRPNTPGETKQAGSYIGGSYKEPEYGERPKTPSGSGFPELTENETLLLGFGEKDAPKSIRNDEKVKAPYKTYESELKPDFKLPGERGGTESVFERSPFSNETRQKLGMEPNEDGVGDVIENKGNTEYPNSFLQNKANYSGLYATEQKMPEVQKANAGDYVSYVGNMFGAGLTSAPMNITSGLQTTLGDIKSGGEYSEGYKKIAEYLRDNPGAKDLIATPRASYWHLANEIGVPEAVLRSYRYANMSADVIEEIDENSNGVSGGFKNVAGNLAYQGGQMAFRALIGNAIAGGMGGGSSAYAEKAINYGLVGGDVFGGALTNTAKEYGDAGAKGYLYSVGNAATEVLTEALLGFGDLSSVQKIFSATGGNNVLNGLKALGKYLANSAGEGVEEVANTAVTGALEKALLDRTKKWVGNGGVFDWSEIGTNAGMGALGGLMFGAGGVVTAISNIKSETDGIRTAAEWLAGYNAQLPEGYKVDMKPVGQITEKDIEAYEKQIVENTEQYMEDVALPEMFARQEARLENVPESEKPKTPSEMTAESFVEYAKEVQRVVESRSSADPAAQEFLDLVQQANAPAAPTPETPAQQTNAQDIIDAAIAQIQSGGVVTNSAAAAVLANPEAVQSLGVNTAGLTASQQRAAVKNAVAQLAAENAQKNTASEVETESPYSEQEASYIRREAKTFRNLIAGIDYTVSDFFRKWRNGRKSHQGEKLEKLYLGKPSANTLEKVSEILGYDVETRDVIVTNDDTKHISEQHPDLEEWVFDALVDVVANPDVVRKGHEGTGKNNGKTGVIFEKQMPNGNIVCIQFDNPGRETLQVTTVYLKNKAGATTSMVNTSEEADTPTSETTEPVQPAIISDTIIAEKPAGVKEDNSTTPAQNASNDGLGAMTPQFPYVERQNQQNSTQSAFDGPEKHRVKIRPKDSTHRVVTDAEALKKAELRTPDINEEMRDLAARQDWDKEDTTTAHLILRELVKSARESKDYSAVAAWNQVLTEHTSAQGQALQANKRFAKTPEKTIGKAAETLKNAGVKDQDINIVLDEVSALAYEYDEVAKRGDIDALFDIVRRVSGMRKTGTFFGNKISKQMEWAISRLRKSGDLDFAKDLAVSSVQALATDYITPSVAEKLKTLRRNAMLSKFSTIMRNVVSNGVFSPVDTLSRNISVPLDALISKYTGTRSVTVDKGVFSKEKTKGRLDGLAKSMLEVGLDLDTTGDTGRSESGSSRTFKMGTPGATKIGGTVARLLSSWEKWMGYSLNTTDAVTKGGIQAEIRRGLQALYESGKLTDEDFVSAGAMQEALYRTFQDDTKLSSAVIGMRRGANKLDVFGVGAGDILVPFAKTPANLAVRSLEYSPVGLANSFAEIAKTMIAAKRGTLTPAQQAKAVQAVGRGVVGSGMIAGAAALALSGVLRVLDTGRDEEDKDKTAIDKLTGQYGTQLNANALLRWFSGESTEWQSGDVLIDISFMDPMNAMLTTGALIAEDIEAGEANAENVVMDTLAGTFQSVMDLPMMQPISDMISAAEYSEAETAGGRGLDALAQFAASQLTSFVPNSVKGIAQGTDGKQRDVYTSNDLLWQTWDEFRASLPFLRQTLPEKLDSFGEEAVAGDSILNFLNTNVLPGTVKKYEENDTVAFLNDVYGEVGDASIYPNRNAPGSITNDGETFDLNAKEKTEYKRTYGATFTDIVDILASASDLEAADANEMLGWAKSYATETAKREFLESKGVAYDLTGEAKTVEKGLEAVDAGIDIVEYFLFASQDFKSTRDEDGKEVKGETKKDKTIAYIKGLDGLTADQKEFLFRTEYPNAKDNISW